MNFYYDEDTYASMVSRFQNNDLQVLLEQFNHSTAGQTNELKERVLDLLRNKPPGLKIGAFVAKIAEIYTENESYWTIALNLSRPESMELYQNVSSTSIDIRSAQLTGEMHIWLKKLPFFQVAGYIIKPIVIAGIQKPKGIGEVSFDFILNIKHCNLVSLNQDIFNGEKVYLYQVQIRICNLEKPFSEISDCRPLGLTILINGQNCPLPPVDPETRHGTDEFKRVQAIDCTKLIKLNPSIVNRVNINWIPDRKSYVFSMAVVKKLTLDILLKNLKDKGSRKSEETKSFIIKRFADNDVDVYRCSLLCPLGQMRMNIPAKSINCDHLECFDAHSFISMNEKRETWKCPICNNICLYDDLQIEDYFLEVISSPEITDSTKEIEILADGTWKVYEESEDIHQPDDGVSDNEKKKIVFVNLVDIDDGND